MMPRIVARLDVRGAHVIKGIRMEGRRIVGDPHSLAVRYYEQGADELLYIDAMASLCEHNSLGEHIQRAADDVFVPMCVVGGLRNADDVRAALRHGADRVGVLTAAVRDESLLRRLVASYGASTVCSIVDCARRDGFWEVLTDYGRESSDLDAVAWAHENAYVGEVIVTSVDRDGTLSGPDLELVAALSDLPCPLTYGGGIRDAYDVAHVLDAGADAVSIGTALHLGKANIASLKEELQLLGREVRV